MDIQVIKEFLLWCSVINMGILLLWFLAIWLAKDLTYKIHNVFFDISKERFNEIHYLVGLFYKLAVFVFFVIPYIVILIIE